MGAPKNVLETKDVLQDKLGNIEIIEKKKVEAEPPIVKYAVPPEFDVIGVNTPKYDCCVQKVVDEMGQYIKEYNMQFVLGNDNSPADVITFFPKYVLYFRSGTVPGTNTGILASLDGHIAFFRNLGIQVFYYLDDFLLGVNNNAPVKLMANCDGIIVSTDALKDQIILQGINRPIYVLRTHMDLPTFDMFPPLVEAVDKERVNILFSSQGRVGITMFHKIVERMHQNVDKYKNVNFICLSHAVANIRSVVNKFRGIKKTYLEYMPLTFYYRLAAAVDMIIAPGDEVDLDYMLEKAIQRPWLDSKSCHKYTLAGAASIPCIASPMADYKDAIKHGETGYIANDLDEWMTYLDKLLEDKEFRIQMGRAAKRDNNENWGIYKRTEELVQNLRGEWYAQGRYATSKKQITDEPVKAAVEYKVEVVDGTKSDGV